MKQETIHKVLNNCATPEEAAQVAAWFSTQESTGDLLTHMDEDLSKEWEKRYAAHSYTWLKRAVSYAACVVLVVGLTWLCGYGAYHHFVQPQAVSQQTAYAGRGEKTLVVLQDGTRIFLHNESQITFPSRFSWRERRIQLDGEAYFEVSKNPHRPFVVEMRDASVTVLGTKFNASSYTNEPVRVTLDEGSVRFSAPQIQDVMLRPGETVCYHAATAQSEVYTAPLLSAGAWRDHRLQFVNMPLADVMRILERQYDVTFEVTNERCYAHAYTLSMEDDDLQEVLRRMAHISHLTFRYNAKNNHVRVSM